MTSRPLEIGTNEIGVPSWRIRGTETVALVCGKCGYIEFYDREKMK